MKKLTIALLCSLGLIAGGAYAFDDLGWYDFNSTFHPQTTHGEHYTHSCHC